MWGILIKSVFRWWRASNSELKITVVERVRLIKRARNCSTDIEETNFRLPILFLPLEYLVIFYFKMFTCWPSLDAVCVRTATHCAVRTLWPLTLWTAERSAVCLLRPSCCGYQILLEESKN